MKLHTQWNTHHASPSQRFDLYRSGLCASFARLTPSDPPDSSAGFEACLDTWVFGGAQMSLLQCTPHAVARTVADLARADDEHVYLNHIVAGRMQLQQGEHRLQASVGKWLLIDNARPFSAALGLSGGRHQHLAIRVPADVPRQALHAWMSRKSVALTPPARLLQMAMDQLSVAALTSDTARMQPLLDCALAALQACCAAPGPSSHVRAAALTEERVLRLIDARYADPSLDLAQAAKALRMSTRTVQLHLAQVGRTFTALLRERRLQAARQWLLGHTGKRTPGVAAAAQACGFQDGGSLHRAFRVRYGQTPAEWARSAVTRPARS